MKVTLINGSPKGEYSASYVLIKDLISCMNEKTDYEVVEFSTRHITEEQYNILAGSDAIVFVFPIYMDGVPAHLLNCLLELEQKSFDNKKIKVYGLTNSGQYEGIHNELAIEIFHNWCNKVGLRWGFSVGIGGGGVLYFVKDIPLGKGYKKSLRYALKVLAQGIQSLTTKKDIYISVSETRSSYVLGSEEKWHNLIKEHGGKINDLGKKFVGVENEDNSNKEE